MDEVVIVGAGPVGSLLALTLARRIAALPQLAKLRGLDLGDEVAHRGIPPGKIDSGGLTYEAPSAVAADEIARPQRLAVGTGAGLASAIPGAIGHSTQSGD